MRRAVFEKSLSLRAGFCIYCKNKKSGDSYELSVGIYDYRWNCVCGIQWDAAGSDAGSSGFFERGCDPVRDYDRRHVALGRADADCGKGRDYSGGRAGAQAVSAVFISGYSEGACCKPVYCGEFYCKCVRARVGSYAGRIAYRSQYGSVNPAAIVGPGIVATAVSTLVAVIFCKMMDGKRRI